MRMDNCIPTLALHRPIHSIIASFTIAGTVLTTMQKLYFPHSDAIIPGEVCLYWPPLPTHGYHSPIHY